MIILATARDRRVDAAFLILRMVVGIVFVAHGWQKIFVTGLDGVTAGFAQMGIPMPELAAPVIAGVELIGGLALILGLWTRVFGGLLAIDMLGAMLFVHLRNGFFLPGGIEFVLTLCSIAVAFAVAGAGGMSVDYAMKQRRMVELASIDQMVRRERRKPEVPIVT